MEYKKWQESIADYLSGNLSMADESAFVDYLAAHPEYAHEVNDMEALWGSAEIDIPEPSRGMDAAFYDMLQQHTTEPALPSWMERMISRLQESISHPMVRQLAYGAAILAVGLMVGRTYLSEPPQRIEYAVQSPPPLESQYVMALMEQPSATKRIQTVEQFSEIGCVTGTIIGALFATLNGDENINVRLSAIEALADYTNLPEVRQGLVASISQQTSPIVQIALADLMVIMQEKEAIEPINQLLKKSDVNESVKYKMEQTLQQLI